MTSSAPMKQIGITLLQLLGVTIVIILAFNLMLKFFTNHNEYHNVPDVKGMPLAEGIRKLEQNNMGYILTDSLFDPLIEPGTIIDQSPKVGGQVKANRKIYITINSFNPPSVKLPPLVDMSKRQAILILESYGLKAGKEIYQPDIAKDAVLSMRIRGKDVTEGILIPKGTTVDLVLGDGLGMVDVDIPDLIGLTVMEAMAVLDAVHLSLGEIRKEGNIEDELSAYIYYQQPENGSNVKVAPGDPVTIYITDAIPQNLTRP
jgi:eukaryotic-like serine/threonine-protein kinase